MTGVVYVLMVTLWLPGSLGTTDPAMLHEGPFQTREECENAAVEMQHHPTQGYTLDCEPIAMLPPEKEKRP
jgi:hypothetical protein